MKMEKLILVYEHDSGAGGVMVSPLGFGRCRRRESPLEMAAGSGFLDESIS